MLRVVLHMCISLPRSALRFPFITAAPAPLLYLSLFLIFPLIHLIPSQCLSVYYAALYYTSRVRPWTVGSTLRTCSDIRPRSMHRYWPFQLFRTAFDQSHPSHLYFRGERVCVLEIFIMSCQVSLSFCKYGVCDLEANCKLSWLIWFIFNIM